MLTADKAAVQNVIDNYVDAMFHANIEALRNCFHPEAVMHGFLGDMKLFGTPEPFFEDIGSKPSMASGGVPYKGEVISLELEGGVASVTLKEEGIPGGISFVNYFHLLKEDGIWRITSKLFTTM
jgi:hypothetical protein